MSKYYILYNDKILRKGRMDDCVPFSFKTAEEAEKFILDHRASRIDTGVSAKRYDYYVFNTDTNLDVIQWP